MKKTWRGTFAAVAALGLLASSAMAQGQTQGDQPLLKQIQLTEKQVQGFISAQKELAPLASKLESSGDKPDPALQAQFDQIAKKNGFSSANELDDVAANISLVLSGLDPQSGQFTEPPEQIKKDMEEIKQDAQMPQKEKDQVLTEMQDALKTAAPLKFKDNVALVKKYQKELDATVSNEPTKQ